MAGFEAIHLGPMVAVAASQWAPFLPPNAHWALLPRGVGSYPWWPLESLGASGVGLAFEKSAHGPSGAVSQLLSESALPFLLLLVGVLGEVVERSEEVLEGLLGLLPYPGRQGQQVES